MSGPLQQDMDFSAILLGNTLGNSYDMENVLHKQYPAMENEPWYKKLGFDILNVIRYLLEFSSSHFLLFLIYFLVL